MTIPFITSHAMEKKTTQVLVDNGYCIDWNGMIKPVEIDHIIEFHYGLTTVWKDLDYLSDDGTVLAAIIPEEQTIFLNESKQDLFEEKIGTENFTLGHELGHWVLHVTRQGSGKQLTLFEMENFYCRGRFNNTTEEIQADMFAARLLMPGTIIRGIVQEIKNKGNVQWKDLYTIADSLQVSISALVNRITGLRLLYIEDKKIYSSIEESSGQICLW